MRVGSVESSQLQRFRESLSLIGFKVIDFDRQEGRTHLVLLGLRELDTQLEPVLKAAGYKVEYVTAGYMNMYQAMADGELHGAMEIWSSNVSDQYGELKDAGMLEELSWLKTNHFWSAAL